MFRVWPLLALTSLTSVALGAVPGTRPISAPLRVHPANGRYFTDGTRTVYLTGSHTWHVLQDQGTTNPPRPFDYDGFLGLLKTNNHNFFRMWTWEHARWACWSRADDFWYGPMPYARVPGHGNAQDGEPKYDLSRFNDAYFHRLRQRVELANRNGIYVAVMLFQGVSVEFKRPQYKLPWNSHPFHRANNINRVDGDKNADGQGYDIHEWPPATGVWELQQAYTRKVIDTVNDLDNVLYEVGNECHPKSEAWQYEVIRFIKQYEAKKPKQHPVGMTAEYPEGGTKDLLNSPADWISPSGSDWDAASPPVATGRKVILADTDHLPKATADGRYMWKAFARGNMPILMDDPGKKDPERLGARKAMGQTLALARRLDLAALAPTDDARECSSTYLLRQPGKTYIAYQPKGASMSLNLAAGGYELEYFDPADGSTSRDQIQHAGGAFQFNRPEHAAEDWVVIAQAR